MSSPFMKLTDAVMEHVRMTDVGAIFAAFSVGFLAKASSGSKTTSSLTPPPSPRAVEQYGYCKELPAKRPAPRDAADCPYEYLLKLYGKHHFRPFVDDFQPKLASEDPAKYELILDIMDAVHFALILVDDISDNSDQRKNQPTAHLIFGASETANRAYLVLTRVINRALRDRPVLGVELMKALEDILQGQDLSLVWRRDGPESLNCQGEDRIKAYRKMAVLKTGTLFVLLGRLLNDGGQELDDLMTRFGWFAQLQNDCKNVYSSEYVTSKGAAIAEDVRNGELSFPIVVALNTSEYRQVMERALDHGTDSEIEAALKALQSRTVKETCLKAMKEAGRGMDKFVKLWGRREQMQAGNAA